MDIWYNNFLKDHFLNAIYHDHAFFTVYFAIKRYKRGYSSNQPHTGRV